MRKIYFILSFCYTSLIANAHLPTQSVDDGYGTLFIVAKKVPDQLHFLMGIYKSDKGRTIELRPDGTGVYETNERTRSSVKYWFECSETGFVGKRQGPDGKTQINILIEIKREGNNKSEPTSFNSYLVLGIVIDANEETSEILTCFKKIKFPLSVFNEVTENAVIAPTEFDCKALCGDIGSRTKAPQEEIEYYQFYYEKRLWELAGVNSKVDSEAEIIRKVGILWKKYKKRFKCDSLEFGVQNGNILKFAISMNMFQVVELLGSAYSLDINFTDPADNMNLLEYLNSEVSRLSLQQNTKGSIGLLKDYIEIVINLGGKSKRN